SQSDAKGGENLKEFRNTRVDGRDQNRSGSAKENGKAVGIVNRAVNTVNPVKVTLLESQAALVRNGERQAEDEEAQLTVTAQVKGRCQKNDEAPHHLGEL